MTTITIPLSEERVAELRIWAEQAAIPALEFLPPLSAAAGAEL